MGARILVACMPKSGSTYLSAVIAALPGFTRVDLVPAYGRREQELCIDRLNSCVKFATSSRSGYVSQNHVRYSEVTAFYIEKFELQPVVLVRNIFDIVVSLIDHHSRESIVYPAAFAPDDIVSRSFDDQARFVVQMAIPWYFNFYVSWLKCENKVLLNYESLVTRPDQVLREIFDHVRIEFSDSDYKDAVLIGGSASLRKNKVVSGRGGLLPSDCVRYIRDMAKHYPGVDFSLIGID